MGHNRTILRCARAFMYLGAIATLFTATSGRLYAILPPGPTVSHVFNPSTVNIRQTSVVTFTISNPAPIDITGVSFTDSLPSATGAGPFHMLVEAVSNLQGSCGGTVTAVGGSNMISLTGGSIPANGSCSFSLHVNAQYPNSTPSFVGVSLDNTPGAATSDQSIANQTLAGATPATQTLTVSGFELGIVDKGFNPATVQVAHTTTLTFNVYGTYVIVQTLSGAAFTDTLPAGLVVANPPNIQNSGTAPGCGFYGGMVSATAGMSTISLSGASLPLGPDSNCTFSVDVTPTGPLNPANMPASITNTVTDMTSTNPNISDTSQMATATLIVTPGPLAPTITKSFSPNMVPLNGASTLSFTITNPNISTSLSAIGFTDTFPSGLALTSSTVTGSCGGGTITANTSVNPNTVTLATTTLAAGTSCTFSVNVKVTGTGTITNTTGAISAFESGPGSTASASISTTGGTLTVDSQGHVLVALAGSNTVQVYDNKNGTLVADAAHPSLNPGIFGAFGGPGGIAVDSKDNIFVSDTGHNRIVAFNSIVNGAAPQTQITMGAGVAFNQPGNLAVDSTDHLLALDAGNHRIVLLTINHSGNNVSGFTQAGTIGPSVGILGQFNLPLDVAVDSVDHILVADSGNHRIAVFKSVAQGFSPLMQIGPGVGVLGQLSNPTGVAANLKDPTSTNKDEIVIVDSGAATPRIVILASIAQGNSARGQIVSSAQNGQLTGILGGLRTGLNGNILLLEPSSSRLAEFSDTGTSFLFSIPITF